MMCKQGGSMKFFHLSDLHIGKQLHRYHMAEEQRDILNQIVELARAEQPDAVLIAGDIYDSPVPSAEAVSIFDDFLTALNEIEPQITVFIIAGNHDSAKRLDFASSILAKHKVYIAGMPPMREDEFIDRVTLADEYGEVDFYLLPFVKPMYVRHLFAEENLTYDLAVRKLLAREQIDAAKRNVIVSHQFYTAGVSEPEVCDSEVRLVGGIENVDVSVLEPFAYAALGHIHRPQKIGREVYRYCGTPLAYSVSEAGDAKSVTVVELAEMESGPIIRELPLAPMRKVRKLCGKLEEILAQAAEENKHDFVSITLTDEVEAYQPKERLEGCFDHILEIRIDNARTRNLLTFSEEDAENLEPYEAFARFFAEMNGREMTEQEDALIREIINKEREEVEV